MHRDQGRPPHCGITDLLEPIGDHVPNPPALVLYQAAQRGQEHSVARLLLLGNDLGDRNQYLDGEQADAVLVVLNEVLEHGYHLVNNNRGGHLLHKLGHVGGGLAAHHGCVVVDQLAELLAELFLDRRRHLGIGRRVQAASRDLGCEPVGLGEADREGDEVLFDLLRGEIAADLVERFDGLQRWHVSQSGASPSDTCVPCAYLVSHDGLLDGCEVLERGEQDMAPLRTADVVDKAPELLAQGNKDLILILNGLCQPGCVSDGWAGDIGVGGGRRGGAG